MTTPSPMRVITSPLNAKTATNNRRNDLSIRSAINSIQDLLFDPQASSKIFKLVLDHIAEITNSDFSVSFVADVSALEPIELNGSGQGLHAIHNAQSASFINTKTLEHWVEQKVMPLRPVFFNRPIPKSYQSLLIQPSDELSLLLLPVVSQNKLRSICILGKKDGDYTPAMITRLMPLLGSVICTLQSADSVKGSFVGLERKISDNRYLSSLLSSSPVAVLVVSSDNKIVTSNPAAQDMFCAQDSEAIQLASINIETLLPSFESLFQWSNQSARYGSETPLIGPKLWQDQIAHRIDGSEFLTNLTVFRYTHGHQRFTTLQIQDMTAMRESAEEYKQASQQLSALTHLVPVGIIRVNAKWSCMYANDKWFEFSGLTNDENQGQQWINAIHSDDVKVVLEELRDALQLGKDYHKELRLVSPLGQIRWVDFNTRVLFNDAGILEGFLGTFADVTERLLHQEKLRQVAEYDGLTGLANRSLFQDRLQQAFYVSEREKSSITTLFLDLDGFKDINDSLGHGAGDTLLQQVAERLLNALRRNDTVARFGGDEFVILLGKDEHSGNAILVAEKLIQTIAQPYTLVEQEVFVTVSIGIAEGTHDNSTPEKILKQADAALYLAKREGKNNFQLFNTKLDDESKQRLTLLNQLRHALKKDRYSLLFQPVANVATGKILGFEALLRFTDNADQLISPVEFIPILEETGMIIEVGKWVIEESCRQVRAWQDSGIFPEDGFLAFNVSPKQLLDNSFANIIEKACEYHRVNPKHLIMEVTETVIINKPEKVKKILEQVKKIGLRLALDDFGTGYSSLSYLQNYPFDHIKIDKSFVDDLTEGSNDSKITKAIIALAASLGLKVTAEGVETTQSLDFINALGADYFQGYLLSRPVNALAAITKAGSVNGNIEVVIKNTVKYIYLEVPNKYPLAFNEENHPIG